MAFMTGYQSIDGVPSTMNDWLLVEMLRRKWGFEGVLVTDYDYVGRLVKDQRVCADYVEAGGPRDQERERSRHGHAGVLRRLHRGGPPRPPCRTELDSTLRRVLALKFRMGLFEDPGRSDPDRIARVVACEEHGSVNLRAARESLVLLKNDTIDGSPFLPLDPSRPRRIAVLGPNADAPLAQLGDWSLGSGQMTSASGREHPRSSVATVADGMRSLLPALWSLVAAPEDADIEILVLGDNLAYVGEERSTATLELRDGQVELADRVAGLGKPVVAVLINSKPLVLPESVLGAQAIFECFNPGMREGRPWPRRSSARSTPPVN